jgi:hypothetical protein
MNDLLVISAMVIWIGDLAYACTSNNSWKSVGITYGILILGIITFGIALVH